MNKEQIERQKKIDRNIAIDIKEMVATDGFQNILKPYLEKKAEEFDSIRRIDHENIEQSYIRNKCKHDVYIGILNKIKLWLGNKEESNARRRSNG